MVHRNTVMTPDQLQSAIQYRAIVQRDWFGSRISLDSLLLVTTLCGVTDRVGFEPRGRNAIWWGLVCGICTLAYLHANEVDAATVSQNISLCLRQRCTYDGSRLTGTVQLQRYQLGLSWQQVLRMW
jgi:hypothetical protein